MWQAWVEIRKSTCILRDLIYQNKVLNEPFSELVHTAFAEFRMDQVPNRDSFSQQENIEVEHELYKTEHDEHDQDNYEDNNERNQCQSPENLPGQVRTTVLDDQDIDDRIKVFEKQTGFWFCVWLS